VIKFWDVNNPHMLAPTHMRTRRTSCLGSASGASQAARNPDVPCSALKQPEYNQNVLFRSVKELPVSFSE
jgi:hypothetical protein